MRQKLRIFSTLFLVFYLFSLFPASAQDEKITIDCEADSYIQNNYNTNFGSEQTLLIRGNDYRTSYLKFPLSGIADNISSAQLEVYSATNTSGYTIRMEVAEHSNWEESTINGLADGRPAYGYSAANAGLSAVAMPGKANEKMTFHLPAVEIEEAIAAAKEEGVEPYITLVLYINDNGGNPTFSIHSREAEGTNAIYRPVLVVNTYSELTDDICVTKDVDELTLPSMKALTQGTVRLPSAGSNGSAITWESDSEYIRIENGKGIISRPPRSQSNAEVTLTATVSKGSAEPKTKDFTATVLSNRHPVEDTYVKDYSPANFNYGVTPYMIVRTNQAGVQYAMAYMKFDLSDLGPDSNTYIESAKLRITSGRSSNDFIVDSQKVAFVPDNSWKAGDLDGVDTTLEGVDPDQVGITAKTKPAYELLEPERSAVCSSAGGGLTMGDVYEFDVLDLVRQQANSDDLTLSLAIYSTDATDLQYQYNSNEADSGRPELVLEVETADETPPGEIVDGGMIASSGELRLVWTDPEDSDFSHVNIYDGEGALLDSVQKTEQNYLITGLTDGENYSYVLKTVDKFGNESEGTTLNGVPQQLPADETAPAGITSLTAETGDGQIMLRWKDPADFDLWRIVVSYNGETLYAPKGAQELLVTGLANNETYEFSVYAEDFAQNCSIESVISQKTTEPYQKVLDSFDESTIFVNNVKLIEGDTPDGSAKYGNFDLNYGATYKRAALNGADIAAFGATGLRFYAKCDTILTDPMLFAIELRENNGIKNYQVQLGNLLNGTEWTLINVPFSDFERTSGSEPIDFEPIDPSAVTEVRLLSYGLAEGELETINISIDAFAAVTEIPVPSNASAAWADGRVSLSFDSEYAVNVYQDGVLLAELAQGQDDYEVLNLSNGQTYRFMLKAMDAKGRESAGVTLSGSPQSKNIQLAYAYVKDTKGELVKSLTPREQVVIETAFVADETTDLMLSYAFYGSDGALTGLQSKTISVQAGENWKESAELTAPADVSCVKIMAWKPDGYIPICSEVIYPTPADSPFSVSSYFASGMVLQREKPITVWGNAPVGEEVVVELKGERVTACSQTGKWEAVLPAMPADNVGAELTVSCGNESKVFSDVLIGDVYLASGQSNMYFKVVQTDNGEAVMDRATDTGIRVFYHEISSMTERRETPGAAKWFPAVGTDSSRRLVYATPFFFAQEMRKVYPDIPIGIVQSAFNGSFMEAWISDEYLKTLDPSTLNPNTAYVKSRWSGLFNGCIAPVAKAEYAAILWYQGESNKSLGYKEKLTTLIENWRNELNQPDLPFLFVNLPAYGQEGSESDYAPKREQQYEVWRDVPNTGMIVAMSWGDRYDIHPTNKQPIGWLWSLVARHMLFGEDIEYSGPVYQSKEVIGNAMYLTFTHADGLAADGGDPLSGFEICGADGIYVTADAVIENGKVKLTAAGVDTPVNARYAWADTPDTIGYTSCELSDGAFLLTYDEISPRYQVGDIIEGFRIMRGASAAIKGRAQLLENNQVLVSYPGDASYQEGDQPVYSFLDFPFKTANLVNSAGLAAVPFRTGE